MVNIRMQTQDVQELSPKIIVIGVGGAGGNAVNNMISEGLEGCEFLVCNTDSQALKNSLAGNQVQLGVHVTGGLGAGSKPEVGKAAAEESLEEVMAYLDGANMAFVTAGMGGGTGTGAAPVIAKACREKGILTIGVITKPFHFEGTHRMKMADTGIEEMQDYVDTLIVIPNQNLFRVANEKTTFAEAFRMADSVLQSGVRGVTDLMVRPGLVNLDFADIRTAMLEMGKAMMGTGEAEGDKRAVEAAEAAINNPLLDDVSMKGAHGVIINVTGGYDMTLFEADEACNRIRDEVDPNANIIFGATFDEGMEGRMRVSIVATGIEREAEAKKREGRSGGMKLERTTPSTVSTAKQEQKPAESSRPQESDDPVLDQERYNATDQSVPQNTALRGTMYRDSFIPPKPAEPSGYQQGAKEQPAAPTMPQQGGMYGAQTGVQPVGSSLQLNPPRVPRPEEKKRSPSLFERITGAIHTHSGGVQGHNEQDEKARTQAEQPSETGLRAPQKPLSGGPAQGSLNIESPSGQPSSSSENELDIPAFLRRQAN